MRKNILLTGIPRSGKSTLLNKVIKEIFYKKGFVTDEVRQNGERIGFDIATTSGQRYIFSRLNEESPFKVPSASNPKNFYGVRINEIDRAVDECYKFTERDLLYLDEIGQMELYSKKFKELCSRYLDSQNTSISTISRFYVDDFIESIKKRKDIILVEISPENREQKLIFVKKLLGKIERAKRYVGEPERFTFFNGRVLVQSEHGIRDIQEKNGNLFCDCDFFKKNSICSHVIATEEIFNQKP